MTKVADELEQNWHFRLLADENKQNLANKESIIRWLMGEDRERFETLTPQQLAIAQQGMDYRYRILQQRYLGINPLQSYRNLINRLGSLMVLRNKILTWVSLSRDRQRATADVLQEVIQEMLNSDRYIQSQIDWIAQCTQNERLRNSLLLASIEEYSLRPIRNQPLLAYRFVNFLRRSQRSGMTQVPKNQMIRLVSDEVTLDDSDNSLSLLDDQAIIAYQEEQVWEEQQSLRLKVKQEFEAHLVAKIGTDALEWFQLYLQGQSQDAIAQILKLPIKQVYRLREKVGYHAIQVFAMKGQPELVANWLEISLEEHNLGLTLQQWEPFWQGLTPLQQDVLTRLKRKESIEAIARALNLKKSQAMGEWIKIYLAAQALRNDE